KRKRVADSGSDVPELIEAFTQLLGLYHHRNSAGSVVEHVVQGTAAASAGAATATTAASAPKAILRPLKDQLPPAESKD
ncbi:hypothetical protein D0N36_19160, partial [Hymenobacter lapidiphilus]